MEYFLYPHMRNKYYSEVKDLPAPLRESRLFQYCLEETPVFFRDTDRIAGWYGYEDNAPEPLPPSPPFPGESRMTPEDREMHAAFQNSLAMQILYTNAHTCINYGEIVDKGLRHFCGRVEEALRETPDNVYLQAMRNSLDAAIRYAGRYAELAKQYAENSRTEEERARFRRIYRALCQVPEHPARDFLEGVQAVWLLHTMVPIADR